MSVGTYALITLEDYKSWAEIGSAELEADAFSIYCSSADATNATVKKTGNILTLVITGGADAGTNAIDLTLAANDTLGELVTEINKLSGWVANLEGWSSAPSTDLKNTGVTHCLGADDIQTLIFYDNYILEKLIDRAGSAIESYLRRNIKTRPYVNERYDGGSDSIFLKNYPLTAVIQVCEGVEDVIRVRCDSTTARNAYVEVDAVAQTVKQMRDGTADATHDLKTITTMTALATAMNAVSGWTASLINTLHALWLTSELITHLSRFCLQEDTELQVPYEPMSGLEIDMETGEIELSSQASAGFLNVFVSYTAGYVTVPYDLVGWCCEFVAYLDRLRETDETLKSEKALDYQWTAADIEKALSPENMKGLKKYQRPLI